MCILDGGCERQRGRLPPRSERTEMEKAKRNRSVEQKVSAMLYRLTRDLLTQEESNPWKKNGKIRDIK